MSEGSAPQNSVFLISSGQHRTKNELTVRGMSQKVKSQETMTLQSEVIEPKGCREPKEL